VHACMRL